MFAFVSPSTFISRRIDLGFALSNPRALTAASKRECKSAVHTKRRFCGGSKSEHPSQGEGGYCGSECVRWVQGLGLAEVGVATQVQVP